MPIFEYVCDDCKISFETLIFGEQKAKCPQCEGSNLSQRFSIFAARSNSSSSVPRFDSGAACGAGEGCCGGGMCGMPGGGDFDA